jgi:lipopolysaccharide export system protein LptC
MPSFFTDRSVPWMALPEAAEAEAVAIGPGLDEDDPVDLSFAGPEPVLLAAPWHARYLDLASAYLPLLLMAVLAAATWWLVRNAPVVDTHHVTVPLRHEADYVMTHFVVQRFAPDGSLRTQIEGTQLRHYPDDDTLEIDAARIRAIGDNGTVTLASAKRALANGDGSEVQLIGDAQVTRPADGKEEAVEFRSEFLHAFRNIERVRSDQPVVVTQGTSVVRAEGMEYDNLARIVELKGRSTATFVPPNRGS